MSLIYKNGDILKATENIIAHQCNAIGVFGGGLALQISKQYPKVEAECNKYCDENLCCYEVLRGESYIVDVADGKQIANCFTQKPNYDTDYQAIIDCFKTLLIICKENNKTICVPYKYGCGIANGDWDVVSNIFEDLSNEYGVDISVYKL